MTAFSTAMYYPWQDIRDSDWLKTASLYWDKIYTLVAYDEKQPYRTYETRALSDAGILTAFRPTPYRSALVAERLASLAMSESWQDRLTEPQKRYAAYLVEEGPNFLPYTDVHADWAYKNLAHLSDLLDWRSMEAGIVTLYLTMYAADIATAFGALLTDRSGMRDFAESQAFRRFAPFAPGEFELENGQTLPLSFNFSPRPTPRASAL